MSHTRRLLIILLLVGLLSGCSPDPNDKIRRNALSEILDVGGRIGFAHGPSLGSHAQPELTVADIESPFTVLDIMLGDFENPVSNEDLRWLAAFPETKIIGIYGRAVNDDGLSHLQELLSLASLSLHDTNISPDGLSEYENLRDLNTISFYESSINDSTLDGMEKLTGVQCVQIIQAPNFTDRGLQHLSSATQLRQVDIFRSPIVGSGLIHLKKLPDLHVLGLTSTKVGNAAIENIAQLKGLQTLNIRDTLIDDEGFKRLSELLPNCRIIR